MSIFVLDVLLPLNFSSSAGLKVDHGLLCLRYEPIHNIYIYANVCEIHIVNICEIYIGETRLQQVIGVVFSPTVFFIIHM